MNNKNCKKKILSIFGTRPEAIKMAPIVQLLAEHKEFESKVCVTGQHRQMLDQVLKLFNIIPDYDLNIMRPNQDLSDITGIILSSMKTIFIDWRPDLILVHGDTTTAAAAALSGYYHKIPIAHVEAGLRTQNKYSPWPEEVNRKIISTMADYHFAPTNNAANNLFKENIRKDAVFVTGNTVIDSLMHVVKKINEDKEIKNQLDDKFKYIDDRKKIILVTGHRRENFGEGFENICNALAKISNENDVEIIYPVHLNPNVQEPVKRILGDVKNIHLIEPQEYLPFVYLMNRSSIILTDSGGIQEEAPSLNKTVFVMRDTTERPEAIEAGTAHLIGTNPISINLAVMDALNKISKGNLSIVKNPYGNGDAAKKIVEFISEKIKF